MAEKHLNLTLRVWRQKNAAAPGRFETYALENISTDSSFLEMLDLLNERLIGEGREPVAFDHDCREGICGACGMVINGTAHGPDRLTTACQLHMRRFADGDTITIEPWRARAFPILKDLVVDRSALDRIVAAGGYTSVDAGGAPDANAILVQKEHADAAMDVASCIGCGACVAACPNASAALFTSAKIAHFALLPQGEPERGRRVMAMVAKMDEEAFGHCTNIFECEAACPVGVPVTSIGRMYREFLRASLKP